MFTRRTLLAAVPALAALPAAAAPATETFPTFVEGVKAEARRKGIRPHIAQIEGRKTPGLDGRTTRHASYWVSQRKRKRIEEIFGWMKAYGGLRRMRMRGIARVQLHAYLVGAAYNLLRLSRLSPATG